MSPLARLRQVEHPTTPTDARRPESSAWDGPGIECRLAGHAAPQVRPRGRRATDPLCRSGRRCPVVGRVTMDQTLVDVGQIASVKRWDRVTVIGQEGPSQVSAQDLASIIGSIPYEIVCSLSSRIPRFYKGL